MDNILTTAQLAAVNEWYYSTTGVRTANGHLLITLDDYITGIIEDMDTLNHLELAQQASDATRSDYHIYKETLCMFNHKYGHLSLR